MADDTRKYDIPTILHEMREEYWQGLTEVEEEREDLTECIVFSLGGERYAFETARAAEVIRVPRLVRVPKVQSVISGVFNLRGEIIAAIDIRPLVGLPSNPWSAVARIVVIKGNSFVTGLLVEGVRGVEGLPLSTVEPLVKPVSGSAREFVRGQINLNGSLVILLDIDRLLASPEILVNQEQ